MHPCLNEPSGCGWAEHGFAAGGSRIWMGGRLPSLHVHAVGRTSPVLIAFVLSTFFLPCRTRFVPSSFFRSFALSLLFSMFLHFFLSFFLSLFLSFLIFFSRAFLSFCRSFFLSLFLSFVRGAGGSPPWQSCPPLLQGLHCSIRKAPLGCRCGRVV